MLGCWEKEESGTDREDEREVTHFFKSNQGDKFREKDHGDLPGKQLVDCQLKQ